MKSLREATTLSHQDFGGFTEVLELLEDDKGFVLRVSAGYGPDRHNDEVHYRLDAEPTAWPADDTFELELDVYTDQSDELQRLVGATGRREP